MNTFARVMLGAAVLTAAIAPVISYGAASKDAGEVSFVFALYFAPAPATDPEAELGRLLRDGNFGIRMTDKRAAPDEIGVMVHWVSTAECPPPTPESFQYRAVDLTPGEGAAIAQSNRAFGLIFSAPRKRASSANQQACRLLGDLADATDGMPWDDESRKLYSAKRWRKDRIDSWDNGLPDIRSHVMMDGYRDPDLFRIVSMGMRKFGLPDLVMSQVPAGITRPAGNLMNACLQALVEGTVVNQGRFQLVLADIKHRQARASAQEHPGKDATGRVLIEFKEAEREDGDPQNEIWHLDFPDCKAPSYTERLEMALSLAFGSVDDIAKIAKGDPEMAAASARARKAFFELETAFRKGLAPNEHLMIKAPFPYGENKEYMWVEVVAWKKDSIEGVLANDPFYVKRLKAGSRVTIPLTDVYDYIHYRPDGTGEGNETGKILEKRRQ